MLLAVASSVEFLQLLWVSKSKSLGFMEQALIVWSHFIIQPLD